MTDLVLASYNMSWASAAGYYRANVDPRLTEAHFLSRAMSPREYWINAFNLLKYFFIEKSPSIVGLQEMLEGPDNIDKIKNEILSTKYYSKTGKVTFSTNGTPTDACVFTIWDKKLGARQYVKCVNLARNTGTDGRPMLMVYTTGGYLIVNLHAPHGFANDELIEIINYHLNTFVLENNILWYQEKTYLVGDFNMTLSNKLTLLNGSVTLMTSNDVKSCCYVKGKKYEREGDYCFGHQMNTELQIYSKKINEESDHQLVWAQFTVKN